jgi:hypothetical protein
MALENAMFIQTQHWLQCHIGFVQCFTVLLLQKMQLQLGKMFELLLVCHCLELWDEESTRCFS